MINLTEQEFAVLMDDFNRLDGEERAAVIESLQGYFDSGRSAWNISCSPATVIFMDFITYVIERG